MFKTSLVGLAALAAVLSAGSTAVAQTAPPAPSNSYTYVAQWQIPRAQWGAFAADFEKNTRPVLEKLGAAGTVVSWGAFEMVVHTPEGYTHGVWWAATSYAGIEAARTELTKSAATSASLTAATGHRDYYLHSVAGNGKPGSGTGGFLTVSQYQVKPGSGQDWRQLWDKYSKPLLDDLVAKGLLDGYSLDVEDVHTENPGLRFVVTLSPNVEAEDKIGAAFDAVDEKRTPDERKTIALQQAAVLEPGMHRDLYAKIIRHWSK
jgi:hypothetical protein